MLKIGLIGLGKMGKYHLNLYSDIRNVELAGVCDVNEKIVSELSAKMKVPGFNDYHELIPLVDAVTIAAPTKFHYEIAKDCLLAGKHVLVEKPVTTDYDEAKELFDIAVSKGLVFHIGHVERFNSAVQELKNIVESPRYIEAKRLGQFNPNFCSDSIVLDLMIHDIDIVINLVGTNVVAIQAMGCPVYSKLADFATVNLAFQNNVIARLYVSRVSQMKERVMSIHEDNALIMLDFTNQDINIYRQGQTQQILGDRELHYKNEFVQERLFVYKDNPLKLEIMHFIDCIEGKKSRNVTIEHDLHSLSVALKINDIMKNKIFGQESITL